MSRPALRQSVGWFLVACVVVFPATWLYSRIQLARDIAWVREFEPRKYRVYGSFDLVTDGKDGQPDTIFALGCRSLIDESKLKTWLSSAVESRIQPLLEQPETLSVSARSLTTGIKSPPKSSNTRLFDLSRIKRFGDLQQLHIGFDTKPFVGGVRPHAKPVSGVDFSFLRCLPELRVLSISGIEFNDHDARELRHLRKLQSLTIDSDGLTDDGLVNLRGLKNLETLRLASRNIQGSGLAEIAGLTNLTKLDISGTPY